MNFNSKTEYVRKSIGIPLFVWGGINTLAGVFYFFTSSEILKGIVIQAFFWGLIDGIIGLLAFFNKKEQNIIKVRKILLVNTFLDIGYIIGGMLLILFSARQIFIGSGYGVIIQGAFLFLADLIHYLKLGD